MKIKTRYFAIVREALGKREEVRDVPDGATAGDLLNEITREAPRLASLGRMAMLMVNQEYVEPSHVLHDGDEFVIIPPVSGGGDEKRFLLTSDEIDPREVEALVADDAIGAIVTFTGTVRDHARGLHVVALDYEAYPPAAEKMLAQIGDEIADKFQVRRVAITHRAGLLKPGEISVVIAVSSAHRDAAFDAARYAIERIKEIVPIWKKEHYEDGAVWIGSEHDYQREIGRIPADAETAG
jgi:molybdopterin synthase catalytic subunit